MNVLKVLGAILLACAPALAQGDLERSHPFDRALGEQAVDLDSLLQSPTDVGTRVARRLGILDPPRSSGWFDSGVACELPNNALRLLSWNVGTVLPHSLLPWSLRLPETREALVVDAVQYLQPQVVTLQETQDLEQVERLCQAIKAATGHTYSAVTTRVDQRREDGRLIATLFRGEAMKVIQLESGSGFRTHALVTPHFTVINVHGPSVSYENRETFYGDIVGWAKRLPQPVIVAGDFNLGPNRGAGLAAVKAEWSDARQTDRRTFEQLRETFPGHTGDTATTSYWLLLDHVMLTSGRVLTERVISTLTAFPMDHHPVLVDLDLGRPQPAWKRGRVRPGLTGVVSGLDDDSTSDDSTSDDSPSDDSSSD